MPHEPFHLASSQTTTQLPTQPQIQPPPRPPQGIIRSKVSPGEFDYLLGQAESILAFGGTEEDVVNFSRMHIGLQPELRRQRMVEGIRVTGEQPIDPGMFLGLSLKAYNGTTFGLGSDFVGTLMGLFDGPGGLTPKTGRDLYRDILRSGSGNVFLDFVAEMGGALLSGTAALKAVGMGGVAVSPILSGSVGVQATAGMVGGTVFGFGNSDGTITERARSALTGGGFGLVAGFGAGAGFAIAAPLLKTPTRAILDKLGSFGNTTARIIPGIGVSEDHARRVMLEVLESETPDIGVSVVDQMRGKAAALRAQGINPTIADIGGDGMLGLLAENMKSRNSSSQKFFEQVMERQAGQGKRLSERLFRGIFRGDKAGLTNAYDAVDDISEVMSRLAKPMYAESHSLSMPISTRTRELILGNPRLRASYEEGFRIGQSMDLTKAGQEALSSGQLSIPPLPQGSLREAMEQELIAGGMTPEMIAQNLAKLPQEFPQEIPIRAIDFMQQGLRRVKERLLKSGGIDFKEFQALNDTLEEILEEADLAAPVFGNARRMWAGFSSAKDAVEMGRGFRLKAPEIVEREIAALNKRSEGLADFYRLGSLQDVVETLEGDISRRESADVAREVFGGRIFGAPEGQDARRIRALFDSDAAANDFTRRVAGQTRLSRTASAAGGVKPTSPGTAFQQSEQAVEGALPFGRASAVLNAYSIARQSSVLGSKKFRARVADDMATFFARGIDNPHSLDIFLDSLEDFQMRALATERFGGALKGGISLTLGAGVANIFTN